MSASTSAVSTKSSPLVFAAIGFISVGILIGACVASAAWWIVPQLMSKDAAKDGGGNAVVNGRKPTEWAWQELQDHLASKGMKTNRAEGRGGMWFAPGIGEPLDRSYTIKLDYDGKPLVQREMIGGFEWTLGRDYIGHVFIVRDCQTPDAANKEAVRIKDNEQRDVLAWNKFTFTGSADTRARLQKILP